MHPAYTAEPDLCLSCNVLFLRKDMKLQETDRTERGIGNDISASNSFSHLESLSGRGSTGVVLKQLCFKESFESQH